MMIKKIFLRMAQKILCSHQLSQHVIAIIQAVERKQESQSVIPDSKARSGIQKLLNLWIPDQIWDDEMQVKINFKSVFIILIVFSSLQASDLHIVVHAQQTEKIKVGLVFVGAPTSDDETMIVRLQKDLEHSGQCTIVQKNVAKIKKKLEFKMVLPDDVYLTVFISKVDDGYAWRLYDMLSMEMMVGKKMACLQRPPRLMAHLIADQLWPAMFNQSSSFASKIAFCKQIWKKRGTREKSYKQIWITDFDGTHPQLFIDTPTVNIAPRWAGLESAPLLFYSENTLSNVQLVMSNMFKKRHVVCCFDGLNMQPSFSNNGKEVVYCLSKDGSSQLYHSYVHGLSKYNMSERLTFNDGNNISPCFIDDDHIVYVSDFETNKPQLYLLDINDQSQKRITDGGYCACPCYSKVNNKLVYSKMIDKGMQLFEYDFITKQHKQLTKGPGSKEEPSWSACGNYIVFGMNEGLKSRIAQLNLITGKLHYLTSEKDHCTYPNCSPVYQNWIGILKE